MVGIESLCYGNIKESIIFYQLKLSLFSNTIFILHNPIVFKKKKIMEIFETFHGKQSFLTFYILYFQLYVE